MTVYINLPEVNIDTYHNQTDQSQTNSVDIMGILQPPEKLQQHQQLQEPCAMSRLAPRRTWHRPHSACVRTVMSMCPQA